MAQSTISSAVDTVEAVKRPSLYYSALVRIKGPETANKAYYSLITASLADEDAQVPEEILKKALDQQLINELGKARELFDFEKFSKSFANKPQQSFKFAEKFTLGAVENADLVGSTPHRLLGFFRADFIPQSIYVWLFTAFIIGAVLFNAARVIRGLLGLRIRSSQLQKEVEEAASGIEICNSTICLGNPILDKPLSKLQIAGKWAESLFGFLFSASLYYWVLWSIASALYGISVTAVPFGVVVAIALPLALACIQTFGDRVLQYLRGKEVKISAEDRLSFELHEKLRLLDMAVGSPDTLSLKEHLDYINQFVNTSLTTSKATSLITKPSLKTKRLRIALHSLMGFGAGFIMTTLIFFAAAPLLGSGLVSVLLPFIAAGVIGILYAIKAFRESTQQAAQRQQSFEQLQKNYRELQETTRDDLIEKLNRFYQIVLDLRQTVKVAYFNKKIQVPIFEAAIDNPDFLEKSRFSPKEWGAWHQAWRRFKKAIHRLVIFIGATETASLIFRVVIGLVGGLATLGLASNPLSLTTIGILMLVVGLGWAIAKMCHFYAEKYIHKEKMFLQQSEIFIRALSREHQYLQVAFQQINDTEIASAALPLTPEGEKAHNTPDLPLEEPSGDPTSQFAGSPVPTVPVSDPSPHTPSRSLTPSSLVNGPAKTTDEDDSEGDNGSLHPPHT